MSAPELERELAGFRHFIAAPESQVPALAGFFARSGSPFIARAPGRLDVMGGIADYSGSLVLELPIREAAWAAAAQHPDGLVRVASADRAGKSARIVELPLAALRDGELSSYEAACAYFRAHQSDAWAAYLVGALLVLMRERGLRPEHGVRVLLASDVPEGKGVSSSAAIEVATMQAIAAAFGLVLDPLDLAVLCQRAENLVVGAPCGVMDQMTAACGEESRLLQLLCQPAKVLGQLAVPAEIAFFGVDSGVRHAITGADYGQVRVAAFMGFRMIGESRFGGFLANVTPSEYAQSFRALLPISLGGAEFLERYGGTSDPVTRVDRARSYPVAAATEHAVFEHFRVRSFAELLAAPERSQRSLELLGELMYQSHASYSACGLGSEGTDRLVELVRRSPPSAGLYGAKITGGGSGGTVAILGRAGALPAVQALAAEYARTSGKEPYVFVGSSPGAGVFGARSA